MANRIDITISAQDKASPILRNIGGALDNTGKQASAFSQSMGRIRDVALGVYLPQLAGKILDIGGAIFTAAGDFQQGMNVFQQVSSATAAEMELVRQKARDLGNDITLPGVSAKTAADAMIELSKAGLSVNDTLAASKGVLALAKAGQLETAKAAEIAANALLAFHLEGSQAARVADLLAAAANASSSDVAGLGDSLQMASAVAALAKRPVEDVVTQLALLANQGIKGSDAGTSLKQMLLMLMNPSDNAAGLMKTLGINVYDAAGKMKSTRDIIEVLGKALKGLTDEQRDAALATIFGADATRSAAILVNGGTEAYDKMAASVSKAGAASDLAAAYSKGLKGNLEGVQSALETVGLKIGEKFLPALEKVTGFMAKNVEPGFNKVSEVAHKVFDFMEPAIKGAGSAIKNDLVPGLVAAAKSDFVKVLGGALVVAAYAAMRAIEAIARGVGSFMKTASTSTPVVLGLVAGFVAYNGILLTMRGGLAAAAVAQGALNAVMMLNPYVLVAAAAIGIVAAYASVVTSADKSKAASERLNIAQDNLKLSTDALKQAQDELAGKQLDHEGAALAVEAAQKRANEAVAQFGPQSLEARQAVHDLKEAQQREAEAAQAVANATDNARKAQAEKVKAEEEVKKSSERIKNSVLGEAGAWETLGNKIGAAREAAGGAKNGTRLGDNVQIPKSFTPGNRGFALGTPYAPGGLTMVGENGPELVNLPRGSQVTPAWQTRGQQGGMGDIIINITGPVSMNNESNIDYFAQRISATQRLAAKGMAS